MFGNTWEKKQHINEMAAYYFARACFLPIQLCSVLSIMIQALVYACIAYASLRFLNQFHKVINDSLTHRVFYFVCCQIV